MRYSDLKKAFDDEVMNASIESVLPVNLNDYLLDFLLLQAEAMNDKNYEGDIAELVSAVLKILFYKAGYKELEVTQFQLFQYVEMYSFELAVEKLNRTTEVRTTSATIDTILTMRA